MFHTIHHHQSSNHKFHITSNINQDSNNSNNNTNQHSNNSNNNNTNQGINNSNNNTTNQHNNNNNNNTHTQQVHNAHHVTRQPASNQTVLSCIYTNPSSIVNKWDEFKATVVAHNSPHIICLAETWFNDKSLKSLDSYTLYNRDRENIRGGGVAIYINNAIDSHECYDLADVCLRSEQVWCVINVGGDAVLVGCVYKPPFSDTATLTEINMALMRAKQLVDKGKYTEMLVAGDFNFADIDWTSANGGVSKRRNRCRPSAKAFMDTISSCFLTQHVMEPTFLTSQNTLDLVFTADPLRVCNLKVEAPISYTDKSSLHGLLTWDFRSRVLLQATTVDKLLYSKGDYDGFSGYLALHNWHDICNNNNMND